MFHGMVALASSEKKIGKMPLLSTTAACAASDAALNASKQVLNAAVRPTSTVSAQSAPTPPVLSGSHTVTNSRSQHCVPPPAQSVATAPDSSSLSRTVRTESCVSIVSHVEEVWPIQIATNSPSRKGKYLSFSIICHRNCAHVSMKWQR